jgi:hypothetical protein
MTRILAIEGETLELPDDFPFEIGRRRCHGIPVIEDELWWKLKRSIYAPVIFVPSGDIFRFQLEFEGTPLMPERLADQTELSDRYLKWAVRT